MLLSHKLEKLRTTAISVNRFNLSACASTSEMADDYKRHLVSQSNILSFDDWFVLVSKVNRRDLRQVSRRSGAVTYLTRVRKAEPISLRQFQKLHADVHTVSRILQISFRFSFSFKSHSETNFREAR